MNVAQMVSLMGTLGVGESQSVETSNEIALSYLNLAHEELYRETCNFISKVVQTDTGLTNTANENTITLSKMPYLISNVFPQAQTIEMDGVSLIDLRIYRFKNKDAGVPRKFAWLEKTIIFEPFEADTVYTFDVVYPTERTVLTMETQESDLPYPLSYQQLVLHGGLYYEFASLGGFRSSQKEVDAKAKWENGKSLFKSYLQGSNKQKMNTFRNT